VQDFSKIAAPLTKLTRKGEKYAWTEEYASAFEELKNKLITALILKTPSGRGGMIIYSDALGKGSWMCIDATWICGSLCIQAIKIT